MIILICSHINKRTQYERPSNNNTRSNGIDWKNASSALSTGEYDNDKNNRSIRVNSDNNMPSSYLQSSSNMFTRLAFNIFFTLK